MSTSARQDREFKEIISAELPDGLLQVAIDYIERNLEPDDVFGKKDLENWAESNGYIKE